ncbi:MAG: tRNA uridine-5-carboxymethylaminomethyl(34) synthesis enzyme MnmG [Candidatus Methylacidiphilales bacterium]|nr:tRNA uridine-5-carboxymethylaminomethyl(34) synthesis enzyme MnmG [Candidatus Methylacidiphilales bacterium]
MFTHPEHYDVVVAGAGHAGCEAALAAARMGCRTLMLTMNLDTIAQMSCNPAIGGLAKGHLVREIDALGGEMGLNTDATGIQFRMLNASKGPSVRAPRAQADKKAYQFRMKHTLEQQENLDLQQGLISQLEVEDGRVVAVQTPMGVRYHTRTVVITTGTFLRALMHVGLRNAQGGRMGDGVSGFSDCLRELGFQVERLKTGTPPRLNGRTINFAGLQRQDGDTPPPSFSYLADTIEKGPQDLFTLNSWKKDPALFHVEHRPCWITHTNARTAEIIRANLDQSPLYCGIIQGIGPRYCPSIEDKIVRFADKASHQVFLEPEGLHTAEYYINGCSTSLPIEAQYGFIRSIPGLEHVEIIRPGYAVEYDFCPPTQLHPTLETKPVGGLYFAGQINGTSGYEEAAAQGLMAGINAALQVQGKAPLILGRHQAYIGVLIDDLVTKGTKEPYRMFTSRAEYRLLLRQDNADLRLSEIGAGIGLATPERLSRTQAKARAIDDLKARLEATRKDGQSLAHWLKKPDFTWADLPEMFHVEPSEIAEQVQTDIKYAGYIQREMGIIERTRGMEDRAIPDWVDYDQIQGLKTEARIKLKEIRPASFGQASRISGINPTDLSILAIWVKRGRPEATPIS